MRLGHLAPITLLALLAGCSPEEIAQVECTNEGVICADGTVCFQGSCSPCNEEVSCGTLACIAGRCRTCADDDQCGPGRLCREGQCVGCLESAQCPDNLACVNRVCIPCGSSTDCGDGRACEFEQCVACVSTGQCDNGKVCVEAACVACTDIAQCPGQQACVNGVCGPCASADECGGGLICAGGNCTPCVTRAQCPQGQLCSANGRCVGCGSSDDCADTEACLDGLCGECAKAADCRPGQICRDGECGACGASSECEDGLICRNRACETCSSSAQCATGEVCIGGHCRGCQSESECNPGEACVNGRCGACTSPDQCDPGEACASGICGPCRTSNECRAGEICRVSTHRCGQPGDPDHLELTGGQNQTGLVGNRLPADVAVTVVDVAGEVVPGVELAFTALQGGGAPGAATVTTDRQGLASTTWRLGAAAGTQTLKVTKVGAPLPDVAQSGRATFTFVATAQANHADHLEIVAGEGQTAAAGTKLPIDPKVRVVDELGNGIGLVELLFTVTTGGGTATPVSVVSDSDGYAQAVVTLGTLPGANRVVVSGKTTLPDVNHTGKATATFDFTGIVGPADHLELLAGDGQTAQIEATLPVNPRVKLVDRFGNAVAGTQLRFAASAGITVAPVEVATDAGGVASTSAVFGTSAGAKTITVSRKDTALPDAAGTGRATITFTETAVPGDPDHLEKVEGDAQTALAGTRVAVDPLVRVVDKWGNSLRNVPITFTVATGGGSVTPASTPSDTSGLAGTAWTLGLRTGAQTLTVGRTTTALPDLAGSGRATITFTATAPLPTTTSIAPTFMPVAGGTLTITGTNFSSDAAVIVGGVAPTVTARTATQLTVTVPASVPRGTQNVVVTAAGSSTTPLPLLMLLKFTPKVDGAISTLAADADWPPQALVTSSLKATDWGGNELRELYLGYDADNVYIGVVGRAEKQNAIVGYLWHDALSATRPGVTGDIRALSDGTGNGEGDGNGCYWQNAACSNNGKALSLDDMLSSGFNCTVAGWQAFYAYGRTGNAIDVTNGTHNAVGARDLGNPANFGWSPATVRHTNTSQEFALPWTTFARDNVGGITRAITKLSTFVRIVGDTGQAYPNQGLPPYTSASPDYLVTSVAELEVR